MTSGLVNLGGNAQVLGTKPDGSLWRVAVQSPDAEDEYLGVLETKDKAIITSGGYERYFEKDGVTYHHIIDPSTGYPAGERIDFSDDCQRRWYTCGWTFHFIVCYGEG